MSRGSYLGGSTLHRPGSWSVSDEFPLEDVHPNLPRKDKRPSPSPAFKKHADYSTIRQFLADQGKVSTGLGRFRDLGEVEYVRLIDFALLRGLVSFFDGNHDGVCQFASRVFGRKGKRIKILEPELFGSTDRVKCLFQYALPGVVLRFDQKAEYGSVLSAREDYDPDLAAERSVSFCKGLIG